MPYSAFNVLKSLCDGASLEAALVYRETQYDGDVGRTDFGLTTDKVDQRDLRDAQEMLDGTLNEHAPAFSRFGDDKTRACFEQLVAGKSQALTVQTKNGTEVVEAAALGEEEDRIAREEFEAITGHTPLAVLRVSEINRRGLEFAKSTLKLSEPDSNVWRNPA